MLLFTGSCNKVEGLRLNEGDQLLLRFFFHRKNWKSQESSSPETDHMSPFRFIRQMLEKEISWYKLMSQALERFSLDITMSELYPDIIIILKEIVV